MARNSNDQTMKEAVDNMLKTFKLDTRVSHIKLIESWEKIMGPTVAKRTVDLKIFGKKMYVKLNSASVRQELFQEKEKIVKLLNDEAGSSLIEEIIFQ